MSEISPADSPVAEQVKRVPLPEIARTFFLFGILGFGGPAAHIALFERELVTHRKWLSREYFLNLLAAINLVPGPNSTELAVHIGLLTGGFWGMILAGLGFIGPAVALSLLLAMLYVYQGQLPGVHGLLIGIQPVVLVLILSAGYRLGRKALDNTVMRLLTLLALIVAVLSSRAITTFLGLTALSVPELVILVGCGVLYVLYRGRQNLQRLAPMLIVAFPIAGNVAAALEHIRPTALDLFGRFLIIGATLFGSGYILASYMERHFVTDTGWMTEQQVIDTLVIGQATPGPLTSTSAAAGYLMSAQPDNILAGLPGALLSTIGVFLPAFIIVLFLGRIVPLLRRSPTASDFLKGVNAGVIALLITAFLSLALSTLLRVDAGVIGVDVLSVILAALAFFALERLNWNPLLLVILGAGIGLLRAALHLI